MRFFKREPEPLRLFDVALHMKDDEGNRAPNISIIMAESEFDLLADDWQKAVFEGGRRAGHYYIERGGTVAQIGIVVSNILGYAAVPYVPVDQSEGDK